MKAFRLGLIAITCMSLGLPQAFAEGEVDNFDADGITAEQPMDQEEVAKKPAETKPAVKKAKAKAAKKSKRRAKRKAKKNKKKGQG